MTRLVLATVMALVSITRQAIVYLPERKVRVEACYSVPEGQQFLNIRCSFTELIALSAVWVGLKPLYRNCINEDDAVVNATACCNLDTTEDCYKIFENDDNAFKYKYHDSCTGLKTCPATQVQHDQINSCQGSIYGRKTTSYMAVDYHCIPDYRVGILPSISLFSRQNALYIMGQEYPGNMQFNEANCTVKTECGSEITIYIVHLNSLNDEGYCDLSVKVTHENGLQYFLPCPQMDEIYTVQTFPTESSLVELQFENRVKGRGKMWLGFSSNATLSVSCPALDRNSTPSCLPPPAEVSYTLAPWKQEFHQDVLGIKIGILLAVLLTVFNVYMVWLLMRCRKRSYISDAQRSALEKKFKDGMTSKGQKCSELHYQACKETGLSRSVILEWIGNRQKKEKNPISKKYERKRSYSKGISGFNLFVHEKCENSNMNDWGKKWSSLATEEKSIYKERAKATPILSMPKQKRALLKNLYETIKELEEVGVHLSALGIDELGNQVFVSSDTTRPFFMDHPNIHMDLLIFCKNAKGPENVESSIEELRKQTQKHLNTLFSEAVGRPSSFPYKAVKEGHIKVNGLPTEVLPLQFPSNYGKDKLKLLMQCSNISVTFVEGEDHGSINDEIDSLVAPIENPQIPSDTMDLDTMTEENITVLESMFYAPDPEEACKESNNEVSLGEEFLCTTSKGAVLVNHQKTMKKTKNTEKKGKKKEPQNQIRKKNGKQNNVFLVESLIKKKFEGKKTFYLVKWKDFPMDQCTWEPEENIPLALQQTLA